MAKESTGSYQLGFVTFGVLATLAFFSVAALQQQWLLWALPQNIDLHLGAPLAQAE
jgi:NNP family nitrate/nitrite transporter-like MFS transporter